MRRRTKPWKMIIRVRPSFLNKNKTKFWRGNYKAKILDSKIRSSHALSKSTVPDTDHDNVGKKYNSTFHGGNSIRPLAEINPGFSLVELLHYCPLIGRELQSVEIFS